MTPELRVAFSEPLDAVSAAAAGNYRLEPADVAVLAAQPTADGAGVTLRLASALAAGSNHRLTVQKVRDASPAHNEMGQAATAVTLVQPAFSLPETVVCDGQNSREIPVAGLPTGAKDAWTINFFARLERQPDNRTLIAGFGHAEDNSGQARYLSKFANGIHFWSSNHDGDTTTPLDVGRWQMLTATYDGATLRVYKDSRRIGSTAMTLSPDESVVRIAPLDPWDKERRFEGKVSRLSIWKEALSPEALALLLKNAPAPTD